LEEEEEEEDEDEGVEEDAGGAAAGSTTVTVIFGKRLIVRSMVSSVGQNGEDGYVCSIISSSSLFKKE